MIQSNNKSPISSSIEINDLFLLRVMSVLSILLLQHQEHNHEESFWSSIHSLQIINVLLSLLDDAIRHPLRKLVSQQLCALLKLHSKYKVKALFSYLNEYMINIFRRATRSDYKRSLYCLFFLESSLAYFPTHLIITMIETILKLSLCDQPILTVIVFRTLDATYQNPLLLTSSLSTTQIIQSVTSVIQSKPKSVDMETNAFYCTCLSNSLILLFKDITNNNYCTTAATAGNTNNINNNNNAMLHAANNTLCQVVEILVDQCCQSEFTQVHIASTTALKRIIHTCIDSSLFMPSSNSYSSSGNNNSNNNNNDDDDRINIADYIKPNKKKASSSLIENTDNNTSNDNSIIIDRLLTSLHALLHLKHQSTWTYSLDVIRTLFEKFKDISSSFNNSSLVSKKTSGSNNSTTSNGNNNNNMILLNKFILSVGELYQSIEFNIIQIDTERSVLMNQLLGTMLKTCGVVHLLQVLPLALPTTPVYVGIDEHREWLLNILQTHLKSTSCRLQDFFERFLSIARVCNQAIQTPEKYHLNFSSSTSSSSDATSNHSLLSTIRRHVIQIWSLFPTFCTYAVPTDILVTFPSLSKILQGALNDVNYPEIQHSIVLGLYLLGQNILNKYPHIVTLHKQLKNQQRNTSNSNNITTNNNTLPNNNSSTNITYPPEFLIFRQESSQFLPLFLMRLETMNIGDSDYSILLQCVTVWATLAPQELVIVCGKNLLKLLLTNIATITTATTGGNEKKIKSKKSSSNKKNKFASSMSVDENDDEDEEEDDDNNIMDGDTNTKSSPYVKNAMSEIAAGWVAVMQALILNLPDTLIVLVYKTIKPLLSAQQPSITLQKRAYHILESIIKAHPALIKQSSSSSSSSVVSNSTTTAAATSAITMASSMEIFHTITDSIDTCHVSARNIRLRCLEILLTQTHLSDDSSNSNSNINDTDNSNNTYDDVINTVVVEKIISDILICLKDSNKKSRDVSMNIMKFLIHKVSTPKILILLAAAIDSNSNNSNNNGDSNNKSHNAIRVAGITGLCVLFLEISSHRHTLNSNYNPYSSSNNMKGGDDNDRDDNNNGDDKKNASDTEASYNLLVEQVVTILNTICVYLQNESMEESRSILTFMRICANILPHSVFTDAFLSQFISTFTTGLGNLKSKFAPRVRGILRKLITRLGSENVRPCLPELDLPLYEYIEKQSRRQLKKRVEKRQSEKMSLLERMLSNDDDSDDDDDENDEDGSNNDMKSRYSKCSSKSKMSKMSKISKLSKLSSSHNNKHNNSNSNNNIDADDHRLSRVKAMRPRDYKSTLPSSLAELVNENNDDENNNIISNSKDENNNNSASGGRKSKKRSYDDSNNNYTTSRKNNSNRNQSNAAGNNNSSSNDNNHNNNDGDEEKYTVSISKETGKVIIKEQPTVISSNSSSKNKSKNKVDGTDNNNTNNNDDKGEEGDGSKRNNQHALSNTTSTGADSNTTSGNSRYARHTSASMATSDGNNNNNDNASNKRQKLFSKQPGEEYRSKKSGVGGDVWKRGMLEPHAYIPLDPKLLNKKNHKAAVGQFASVVKNQNHFTNNKSNRDNAKGGGSSSGGGSYSKKKGARMQSSGGNRNQRKSNRAHGR